MFRKQGIDISSRGSFELPARLRIIVRVLSRNGGPLRRPPLPPTPVTITLRASRPTPFSSFPFHALYTRGLSVNLSGERDLLYFVYSSKPGEKMTLRFAGRRLVVLFRAIAPAVDSSGFRELPLSPTLFVLSRYLSLRSIF